MIEDGTKFLGVDASVPTPEVRSSQVNAVSSMVTIEEIAEKVGSINRTYLVYSATVTQTGTNAPVSVVLENTFGYTPVWSYDGVGEYSLTFEPDTFLIEDNVFILTETRLQSPITTIGGVYIDDQVINFHSYFTDFDTPLPPVQTDGIMFKSPIEIRYYL